MVKETKEIIQTQSKEREKTPIGEVKIAFYFETKLKKFREETLKEKPEENSSDHLEFVNEKDREKWEKFHWIRDLISYEGRQNPWNSKMKVKRKRKKRTERKGWVGECKKIVSPSAWNEEAGACKRCVRRLNE